MRHNLDVINECKGKYFYLPGQKFVDRMFLQLTIRHFIHRLLLASLKQSQAAPNNTPCLWLPVVKSSNFNQKKWLPPVISSWHQISIWSRCTNGFNLKLFNCLKKSAELVQGNAYAYLNKLVTFKNY